MACTSPVTAYRSRFVNENGKRPLVFNRNGSFDDLPVTIPCGNCIGCRLDRSRAWALRCVHESKCHTFNCFITLTYDEEHLPGNTGVDKTTLQLFFKRLRKAGYCFRYFACGEYGDLSKRPHYHAILFGEDFHSDRKLYKRTKQGNLYTSDALTKAWGFGHAIIANFSFQTAAYVASYVIKKRTGEGSSESVHYSRVDLSSGEIFFVDKEFVLMSRKPGIGSAWFQKYQSDVFPSDYLVHKDQKFSVPRFYYEKLKSVDDKTHKAIKAKRNYQAHKNREGRLPERLEAKRVILNSKQSMKVRTI